MSKIQFFSKTYLLLFLAVSVLSNAKATRVLSNQTQQQLKLNIELLTAQAENGEAKAQYQLFMLYQDEDKAKAMQYLKQAFKQNYPLAIYTKGSMYYHGDGIKKDVFKGIRLLETSNEYGNVHAAMLLGLIYSKDDNVKKDPQKAFDYFLKAEAGGYLSANLFLANAYYRGKGVAQDQNKALEVMLKAQQAGYIPDQQTMKEYDLCKLEIRIVNGQDMHTFECPSL